MNRFNKAVLWFGALMVLVLIAAGLLASKFDAGKIVISEVRNDYGSVLYSASGSSHGFIELYNNSDTDISLDGYYLSDTKEDLSKYPISGCVIPANEYVVFWSNLADDIRYIQSYQYDYFLGFSLDQGESAFLTNPDGVVVDSVTIPDLEKGTAYAQGLNDRVWAMREATPGTANTTARISVTKIQSPVFSLESGFYTGETELAIHAFGNCDIYYTLDGSVPDQNSIKYETPFVLSDATANPNLYSAITNITLSEMTPPEYNIPKANVVRAVAIDQAGNKSSIISKSYFIDFESKSGFSDLSTISMIVDPEDLFGDTFGLYVLGDTWNNVGQYQELDFNYQAIANYALSGKGWRRQAEITLFDIDNSLIDMQNVAVSIHGGASVLHAQKGFNLYALPVADGKEQVFPDLFAGNQTNIMLRAGGYGDWFDTKIRDILNQTLVEDRAVGIQHAIPCQVFINGEYFGLYNLQERVNADLVSSTYGVNPNNVILLKNNVVTEGEPHESALYHDVVKFATSNDLSVPENYEAICEMIDIQSFIDYFCFQIYIANRDSIGNNFARWRSRNVTDDKYSDGKWRWILYDTDDSVGISEHGSNPTVNSFTEGHHAMHPVDYPLFAALIKNETFLIRFADSFIEIAEKNFNYEKVERLVDELAEQYCSGVVISHNRFGKKSYTEDDFYDSINTIKAFYKERYAHIYEHMLNTLDLRKYGYE